MIAAASNGVLVASGAAATLLSALTGVASWWLSKRAQDTAARRQQAADSGPYVESLQGWSADLISRYQSAARDIQAECDHEIDRLGAALEEERRRVRYWKGRALDRQASDDTPPEGI